MATPPLKMQLHFTGVADPRKLGREGKRLWRECLVIGAEYWRDHIAPRHFEQSATGRYGYQPRTAGYQIYKAKATHQTAPLMFSKEMQREVENTARGQIRGYPTRAVLTMKVHVPQSALNPKPGSKHPPLGREMAAVRPDEALEVAAVVQAEFVKRLPGLKDQQSVFVP